ncbi:MAG: T9SS type A sorting domain-containing protein [Candidatus Marinimicrobia bacterium]|nr:T9SS type A sorting domain-containing protein [Candidatus Neomarinimicrobiota bacterium]MBT3682432.1 T9SS type A sorting domain-containing protein [Candidatus Neomarinimicrobiota bacterium]MBT3759196.1 T9SS type A sorting domain-containing protein [Candidatus Neomarinimicrobiota bacterium]MBT4172378.1 T9SS type A sorting domain-containing protein [Candidatus Neomarinimicrobiota bacterium]MBT4537049.1 T9SS type A sorting domain-containing protein [Candidatus Neomarinimicrobiota bacterium]
MRSIFRMFSFVVLFAAVSAQYYNVEIEQTGEYQLISFQSSITGLQVGDEIGVFDTNAIMNSGNCDNEIGELLVGAGVWDGSQINISAIGSLDYCAFGGDQFAGWVDGNPVVVKIYRQSTGMEYAATVTYSIGTGSFGDLLLIVSEITIDDTPVEDYYNVDIDETGEWQLISLQTSITFLEPGDEIGIFDANAILNSGNCDNDIGELLVGAGVWDGSQLDISAIGSLDYCAFGGDQFAGWVDGNEVIVRVYEPDTETETEVAATYLIGTGHFGDLLLIISELTGDTFCDDIDACNYGAEESCWYPEDEGWCDCEENVEDCFGECGGTAELDDCGVCDGLNADMDCSGECFGDAYVDDCGVCDGMNADMDCSGECFGDAYVDDCGICDGMNADMDCLGECFGDAYVDDCGVCDGMNADMDCSGECFGDAELDDCGVCEGMNADMDCSGECFGDAYEDDCDVCDDNPDNDNEDMDCAGVCFGNSYEDFCGVCDDDPENDCPELVYFTDLPPETGVSSLILVNVTGGLNEYDEVGLFDAAGLINYNDCSDQYGEILVGASAYLGEQMEIVATGSVDNCAFGGVQLSGYVAGNPVDYKIWNSQDEACGEYAIPADQVSYAVGNGVFGDIITVANLDANRYGCMDPESLNYDPCATAEMDGDCQYFTIQTLELLGLRWNNISFNVEPLDPAVENLFPADDVLIVTNDQSQFYLPGFGVNMINDVQCSEGYSVYLTGVDPLIIEVEGAMIVDCPIDLFPLFWNNIAYHCTEAMDAADAFNGIPVLLVTDDSGNYYLPGFGVNTIDSNGGMQPGKGYRVYLEGSDPATLEYDCGASMARGNDYLQSQFAATQSDQYQITETGMSHPILIESIEGNVSVGDEIVAYANGDVVGAIKITDLNSSSLLVAWEGYENYNISLDGYTEGDNIELRLWSYAENTEKHVEMDLNNYHYGSTPLTTGNIIVTDELAVPENFALSAAYPNPFNPTTTVNYRIPQDSNVKVEVYAMTGQLVTELVNQNQTAGYYQITWNAGTQPSGIYFVKLTAGNFSQIQKVMLVK